MSALKRRIREVRADHPGMSHQAALNQLRAERRLQEPASAPLMPPALVAEIEREAERFVASESRLGTFPRQWQTMVDCSRAHASGDMGDEQRQGVIRGMAWLLLALRELPEAK